MKLIATLFILSALVFVAAEAKKRGNSDVTYCPNVNDATYPKGHLMRCAHRGATCCPGANFCCPPSYSCGPTSRTCIRSKPGAPSTASLAMESSMPASASSALQPTNVETNAVTNQPAPSSESSAAAPPMSESSSVDSFVPSQPLTPITESEESSAAGGVPAAQLSEASSSESHATVIVMKNVNALYHGPPRVGENSEASSAAPARAAPAGSSGSSATSFF